MTNDEIAKFLIDLPLEEAIKLTQLILYRIPNEIDKGNIMSMTQAEMLSAINKKGLAISADLSPDDMYYIISWENYKKILPYIFKITSVKETDQDINKFDCDKRAYLFCSLMSMLFRINGQGKSQGKVTFNGEVNYHAWCNVVAFDENKQIQIYLVDPHLGAYMDTPITDIASMNINQTSFEQSVSLKFI